MIKKSIDNLKEYNLEKRKAKLMECLRKNKGLVYLSCRQAGLSHTTFYNYLQSDENFRNEYFAIREETLDYVENKLFEAIERGEPAQTLFFLKCQGKKRGWIERQDLHVSGDENKPLIPKSFVEKALEKLIEEERKKYIENMDKIEQQEHQNQQDQMNENA